jgi:predicted small secreted protein
MSGRVFRCALAAGILLLLAVTVAACSGCGDDVSSTSEEETWPLYEETAGERDNGGSGSLDDARGSLGVVHMCGRSVLGGWFEHWGWDYDYDSPQSFGSYRLVYHEMDVPPGIVDTAVNAAREAAAGGDGLMFFKLCFDDFEGGDEDEAGENLEENKRMLGEIVEVAVEEEGLTLIVGNALPRVREYTDEWLVWNHREYNSFLDELAKAYGGRVIILDLYGTLSTPEGWLRPEYAVDDYDSHLSEKAYDALDAELAGIMR